jgi:F-box domain
MASNTTQRLSDLPDDVLHGIMSRLSPKDITRLSLSSTTWRKLCPYVPYLCLNLHEHKSNLEKLQPRKDLAYADQIFSPYRISGLFSFKLISHEQNKSRRFTQLFISIAMTFRPQYVSLDIPIYNFSAIFEIFTCKHVKELYLTDSNHTGKLGELAFPYLITLISLRNLRLEYVRFYERNFAKMVAGCPNLEELSLKCCFITVSSIFSAKLKILLLEDCTFKISRGRGRGRGRVKQSFCAPNLVSLKVVSSGQQRALTQLAMIVYALHEHQSPNLFSGLSGIQHLVLCGQELMVYMKLILMIFFKLN